MIFGFNTDVRDGDTVYHVQSEARVSELLLQTQVFVRGRCIGKRATSYDLQLGQPALSEQQIHELLKAQHRAALDAVRDGRVQEFLFASEPAPPSTPINAVANSTLILECLNLAAADGVVRMRFLVTLNGKPVHGAQLTSRLALSHDAPLHSEAVTGAEGLAEITIRVHDALQSDLNVLVQATHAGRNASRKFRLKRSN